MTNFGPITQLGYLTDNIDEAAGKWVALGVGPWMRMTGVKMSATMDGETVEIEIDLALSYRDDIQMELIQPNCDSPSPYQRNKQLGLWGSHHTQFTVDDMDSAIEKAEAAGMETACIITSGGARYIYLRSSAGWIELTAPNPGLQMMFDMIKKNVTKWDGETVFQALG